MVAIMDSARITVTGAPTQFTGMATSIEERAWLMWTRFRESSAHPAAHTEVPGGILTNGSMKTHARFLFPEVAWGDTDAEAVFMEPVYKYLRRSGNAKVIRRRVDGTPYVSEWFLSSEWLAMDEGRGRKTPPTAYEEKRTRAERRLTAAEAGEDRTPMPVTTTKTVRLNIAGRPISEAVSTNARESVRKARLVGHALAPTYCREPGCEALPPFSKPAAIGGHVAMHNRKKRQAAEAQIKADARATRKAARLAIVPSAPVEQPIPLRAPVTGTPVSAVTGVDQAVAMLEAYVASQSPAAAAIARAEAAEAALAEANAKIAAMRAALGM